VTGASCEAQASVLAHPPSWLRNPRSLLRWLRCGDVVPSSSCGCPFGEPRFREGRAETIAPRIHRLRFARVVSHVGSSHPGSPGPFGPRAWTRDALGWLDLHLACARSRGLEHALRRSFEPSGARCSYGTLFTCDVCATRSWVAH
jgi:hypothetical protein